MKPGVTESMAIDVGVVTEGCVDAALAESFVEDAGLEVISEPIVVRGWREAVSHAISLALQTKTSYIVFIDADEDPRQRLDHVLELMRERLGRHVQNQPYRYALSVKVGKDNNLMIILWLDPENPSCGTVECLLEKLVQEAYNCQVTKEPPRCNDCPAKMVKYQKIYGKLQILSILSACAGLGTLASTSSQEHCGLPMKRIIRILGHIKQSSTYQEILNTIKEMTFIQT